MLIEAREDCNEVSGQDISTLIIEMFVSVDIRLVQYCVPARVEHPRDADILHGLVETPGWLQSGAYLFKILF